MAAKKKKKVKKKAVSKSKRYSEPDMYREFLTDLLAGINHAVQLYDERNARGQLEMSYEEEEDDE